MTTTTSTLRDAGITIGRVSEPSSGGYEVPVTIRDEAYSAPVVRVYGTGRDGHGLWVTHADGTHSQVLGTAQFRATSPEQFRRYLRRYLRAHHLGI